jgi:hypothetical protein
MVTADAVRRGEVFLVNLDPTRALGAILWTQDADFERMPGVEYRERKG